MASIVEIIKKEKTSDNKDLAWVRVGDDEAHLFEVTGKSDEEILDKGEYYKALKERLKEVQKLIEEKQS